MNNLFKFVRNSLHLLSPLPFLFRRVNFPIFFAHSTPSWLWEISEEQKLHQHKNDNPEWIKNSSRCAPLLVEQFCCWNSSLKYKEQKKRSHRAKLAHAVESSLGKASTAFSIKIWKGRQESSVVNAIEREAKTGNWETLFLFFSRCFIVSFRSSRLQESSRSRRLQTRPGCRCWTQKFPNLVRAHVSMTRQAFPTRSSTSFAHIRWWIKP